MNERFIVTLLLLSVSCIISGQTLKGKVLDSETKEPIGYAVAYFDGTAYASYTDLEGKFSLITKKIMDMPLTISALGYYSINISDYSLKNEIIAYLTPKIIALDDINVKTKGNPNIRKQNMEIFKTEFLGRTKNAKQCEILNEDDIRFSTSKTKDTLNATSLKPIFVLNHALGYKITYYLNKFEYVKSKYQNQLIGNSIFDEDTSLIIDPVILNQKRNDTYFGSKMHLIRSLWADSLKEGGYIIKNEKKEIFVKDLVRNQLTTNSEQLRKTIYYQVPLPVTISIKWEPSKAESGLELLRNNIQIDQNGYYKGPGIIWHGEMARQGIADLLPFDFMPTEKMKTKLRGNFVSLDSLILNDSEYKYADFNEKVYLHTDRNFYNSGDIVWFKSYLVDGYSLVLSDSSKILRVELLNKSSDIIDSKIIKLVNGLGNGEFTLADTLRSGTYFLRTYTNYMRNFGESSFCVKEIRIINSAVEDAHSGATYSDPEEIEIEFFPEGGSLIDNVRSVVAFKANSPNGLACDITGEIYSSGGALLTKIKTLYQGMGKFDFKPIPGLSYYALIKKPNGKLGKYDLPKALPKGFTMTVRSTDYESTITLKTNPESLPRYLGRDLMFVISKHEKPIKFLVVKIDSLNNTIELPTDDLPEGIYMITLMDLENKPLCERLIYIQNNEPINLVLEPNKQVYNQRDSVELKLFVEDNFSYDTQSFLSLSVTENIYLDNWTSNISSWYLLESDVKGPIQNPAAFFDRSIPERLSNLDLLLMTQGWRDFVWKYTDIKYPTETGFIISGKVRNSILDIPLIGYSVNVGLFQDNHNIFASTETDSLGLFRFEIEDLTGKANLVISTSNQKGNPKGKLILNPMEYFPSELSPQSISTIQQLVNSRQNSQNYEVLLKADEYNRMLKKKYTLSDTILIGEVQVVGIKKSTPKEVHINQSRISYGLPDRELEVTPEMESIRSFKDLLLGRIAGIYPSPDGKGLRVGAPSSMMLNSDPLYVLDGMVVPYSVIEGIPVSWIDRIDVLMSGKAAAYGMRGSNGVISVISKTKKDVKIKQETYSLTKEIYGFDSPRIFYSPKHETRYYQGQMPDNRTTLFWYPDIKANNNQDYILRYYNADKSASYIIQAEGITSTGIPITGTIQYEVK